LLGRAHPFRARTFASADPARCTPRRGPPSGAPSLRAHPCSDWRARFARYGAETGACYKPAGRLRSGAQAQALGRGAEVAHRVRHQAPVRRAGRPSGGAAPSPPTSPPSEARLGAGADPRRGAEVASRTEFAMRASVRCTGAGSRGEARNSHLAASSSCGLRSGAQAQALGARRGSRVSQRVRHAGFGQARTGRPQGVAQIPASGTRPPFGLPSGAEAQTLWCGAETRVPEHVCQAGGQRYLPVRSLHCQLSQPALLHCSRQGLRCRAQGRFVVGE
jgi:hypothetical protein